ncbi:hypothetical protein Lsai_3294 [Legionella sainthelensi]|uniref:Coiled-coil protein n=1 Tax=Legionella sainthelensi TaxID=28087 RepID=A0A0W0YBZ7_9GAMM|nr:hypothetical protein [Legionella sainthelensi]KTD54472.1 hypothetical protein Lsai_3294 [Legionella sainthelensi]VEH33416.1 Uncharacterised protein [Legionella sainthelensi]
MPYPIGDQACSTWALSGDESSLTNIHQKFMELADNLLNQDRSKLGNNLQEQRLEAMRQIVALRDPTEYPVEDIYFCGCFNSEEDLVASHFWIEDHTHGITTDTFINRDSVVVIDEVGIEGKPFRSGCEGKAFPSDQITRVKIDGYTKGQVDILINYTRPQAVIESVIQAQKDDILSSIRLRDESQYKLDNITKFPHRNTENGRKQLNNEVIKFTNQILMKEQKLEELMLDLPKKPPLPQSRNGNRIDIYEGSSKLRTAMAGALKARQAKIKELAPETIDQHPSSSLVRSLNSTLDSFVMRLSTIVDRFSLNKSTSPTPIRK